MTRILNARNFGGIILAIAAGILAVQSVSGSEPYLISVGPPSLRYESTATNNPLFMAELALPKPEKANTNNAATHATASATANTHAAPAGGQVDFVAGGYSPGNFWDAAKNAEVAANPASDMLSITPQMINDYFKPNRVEAPASQPSHFQPGDTILVPTELGFVPPIPAGSQAIYISR